MPVFSPESAPVISRRDTIWYYALLLGLVGLTLFVLSPNYEENDDLVLRWLLRGTMFGVTRVDVRPFLPLISHALAAAYRVAPSVPFYDLLLTGLTLAATGLTFELLRPVLLARPRALAAGLVVIVFCVGFAESLLIVNFTRPAILLGAAIVLYLVLPAQRRPVGVLVALCGLYFLALGLRHPGAILGGLMGVAGALALRSERLTSRAAVLRTVGHFVRRLWPLGLTLVLFLGAMSREPLPPAQQEYARTNALIGGLKDYLMTFLPAVTPATSAADAATVRALDRWMYSDHEHLTATRLATLMTYDWPRFRRESIPTKLRSILIRNSGKSAVLALLIALGAALYRPTRAAGLPAFLMHTLFVGLMVTITVVLKMPMRVYSPLFGLTILVTLWLFLTRRPPVGAAAGGWRMGTMLVLTLLVGLRLWRLVVEYSTAHAEQVKGRAVWQLVQEAYPGRTVLCGLGLPIKQITPVYQEPTAANSLQLLHFASWSTAMPVNRALMYAASGDSVWVRAVTRLAQRPDMIWIFSAESYAAQQAYLRALYGLELPLVSTPADQQFADNLCSLIGKKKGTVVAMSAPAAGPPSTPAAGQ